MILLRYSIERKIFRKAVFTNNPGKFNIRKNPILKLHIPKQISNLVAI